MIKISIDRNICAGTGACAEWLPDVFELDDDGYGTVRDATAAPAEEIKALARACPTGAITAIDAADG